MEHARKIRELARHFRISALMARDPFLCCELHELADICEEKASHSEIGDEHPTPRRIDEQSSRLRAYLRAPETRPERTHFKAIDSERS